MQCHEFETRMQSVLDARQAPQADAQLAGHAAECADCRHMLAAMLAVVEGAEMLPAACSSNMADRVLDEMNRWRAGSIGDRRKFALPRRVPSLRWSLQLAAAAALVLALPLFSWLTQSRTTSSQRLADAGSAHVADPAHVAQERPAPQDFSSQSNPGFESDLDRWGNDVREGLAPVSRSTAGALESLWQALNPVEDSRS